MQYVHEKLRPAHYRVVRRWSPRVDNAAQLHQLRLADIGKYTLLRCHHCAAERSIMHTAISKENTEYQNMALPIRAASYYIG